MDSLKSYEELLRENEELRRRLDEPEEVIRAISGGEVDAFVVRRSAEDDQVLVLAGVDRPYRLLIERMHQGAATVTRDGCLAYLNRRLAEMVGTTAGELLGTSFLDLLVEEDRKAALALLEDAATADSEAVLGLRTPAGPVPVLVAVSTLEPTMGVLCVMVTDLTQQKRDEAERGRLAEEQAARRAAEQTSAALREADRRKDEFLAMLAHELRNPLAPLRNGISILELIGSTDPEHRRVREMMSRQIDSLVRLVDDLLDLGRITQGKLTLHRKVADLRTLVEQAVEACRPAIDARGQSLDVTLCREPIPVRVDATRIVQVVSNLLGNASKFTRRGGVIRVAVESGRQAVLRISDNGIGIAPEVLPRIFELFSQADPTGQGNESGLGIGLALARKLVEMHGGQIEARSEGLGRGSEFIVRLALHSGPPSATRSAAPQRTDAARQILVVDDNRDAADALGKLLALQGHRVRLAYCGKEAFDVVPQFLPNVVLVDIDMPQMNGFEVVRGLRDKLAAHDVKFVAVTGHVTDDDRRRAYEAGFHHHLAKPVPLDEIEAIISATPPRTDPGGGSEERPNVTDAPSGPAHVD